MKTTANKKAAAGGMKLRCAAASMLAVFMFGASGAGARAQAGGEAQVSLHVVQQAGGGVSVEWLRDSAAVPVLGWHLERLAADGSAVRINTERVAAGLFDPPSFVYRVQDDGVAAQAGDSISYRLVTVDPDLQEHAAPFVACTVAAAEAAPAPVAAVKQPKPRAAARAVVTGAEGSRLRIVVTNDGLYRVTAAEIAAALADLNEAQAAQAIAQNQLALSCGGESVAWRGEAGGAALVFFGRAYRDLYTDRNVYWLESGSGLQMAVANRAAGAPAAEGWFWETARAAKDLYFMPYLPGAAADDFFVWAGQQVTAPNSTWSWTTNVALVDLHPDMKAGTVTAHLVSAYDSYPALDNRTRLSAGGQLLDDQRWAGDIRLAQAGAATNLSGSQVSVTVEIRREADVSTTTVLIDALEVRYARRLRALNNQLLFAPEAGAAVVTVRGFTSGAIRVFDVAEPARPVELLPAVAADGANWMASWTVDPAAAGRYLAVASFAAAEKLEAAGEPGWAEPRTGAPHVVIAPRALTNAAAALVNYRRQQGLDSLLVPVEELHDSFTFGRRDPRAIPLFLAYARANWFVAPAYICLAGDGHIDYYDRFGQQQSRPNHLPPIQDRFYTYTSSGGTRVTLGVDNPLADLDGDGDPDLALGRLPAQTPAALTRMIDRIIAHEASDAWKSQVTLIADRDPDNAFALACARVAERVPDGLAVQQIAHTYSTSTEAMRAAYTAAFNAGPLLSLYIGHASNAGLGYQYFFEHNFARTHMPALTNLLRNPFVVAGACMLNDFAAPHPDNRCAGKGFLDTAPGGAIAVWGWATESTLPLAEVCIDSMLDELGRDHDLRLGDMIRPALDLQANGSSPWMVRAAVLLGDPATRMRTHLAGDATAPAVQFSAPAAPVWNVATSRLDVAGTATDAAGVVQVRIRNAQTGVEAVAAGTAAWSLAGVELAEGTNFIAAIATDGAGNAATAAVQVVYTIDRSPLAVRIQSPTASGSWAATVKGLDLAGTASGYEGVDRVVVRNTRNGAEITAAGTAAWSAAGLVLVLGTNDIEVTAYGLAGGTATAALQVVYSRPAPLVQKINCGGAAAGDWAADGSWTVANGGGAASSTAAIANLGDAPAAVYRARRYGSTVTYNLAIPDGTYTVRLHFAELAYTAAGQRRFNVAIEGAQVLSNYDIWAAAGGINRAVVQTFERVEVRGGLQIQGTALAGTAQFNGIEVATAQPGVVAAPAAVTVPEDGGATFGVRLSDAPEGAVEVAVAKVSGDAEITVADGAVLVFDETNYAVEQFVALAAAADADAEHGEALIRCTAANYAAAAVAVREQDADVPPVYVKINAGGGALADGWQADTGSSVAGGVAGSTAAIAGATNAPAAMYQSRRHGRSIAYNLNIPDGYYTVRLHFAEVYWNLAGKRKFNVSIEGRPVLTNFDIFAAAGGKNRATSRTFECIEVRGGLQIDSVLTVGSAQINGLEVWTAAPTVLAGPVVAVPENGTATFGVKLTEAPEAPVAVQVAWTAGDADVSVADGAVLMFDETNYAVEQAVTVAAQFDDDALAGTATLRCEAEGFAGAAVTAVERDCDTPPVHVRINSGAGATGDWTADTGVSGAGGGKSVASVAIENAGDVPAAVYQSRRYGSTVTYTADIPDGRYTVRLHFAELYWNVAGKRVFNVSIEGQPALVNFDIVAAAGAMNRAVVQTFENVEVTGGLQIQGVGLVGVAQFNGIEVISAQTVPVRKAPATKSQARVSAGALAPVAAPEAWPLAVARSGNGEWTDAASLVDGDTNTVWTGTPGAESWTVALDFEEPVSLESLQIDYAGAAWAEVGVVGTGDLVEWYNLEDLEELPVACRALYLSFRGDGSGAVPAIREINWEGALPF